MRPSEESEKVLEHVKKETSRKKNTPHESGEAEPTCPCLGHVKDRPKHCVAPKATPLAP